MAIDPSISLGVKPIALPDPVQLYGNAMALQTAQQRNALLDIQTQGAQRSLTNNIALQNAFSDPAVQSLSPEQQAAAYLKAGGAEAIPVLKGMAENRKLNVETNNADQTGQAAIASEIAKVVGASNTPQDLMTNALIGIQQGRFGPNGAAKFAPVALHLGSINDQQSFQAFKQQTLDAIRNPDNLAAANTSMPTAQPTGDGATKIVEGNPRLNPNYVGSTFQANPTAATGANGEVGSMQIRGGQPTFTPATIGAPPVTPPPVGPVAAAAGRFAGDPNAVAAAAARISDPQDRASALQAVQNWRTQGSPQGGTVQPTFAQWSAANPTPASTVDPTQKNYAAPKLADNFGEYQKALQGRVETYQNLLPMIDQFQNAMQNYTTGPGAGDRLALAKAIAAIPGVGADNKIVQAINRGSISSPQEIEKLQGQMALEMIKSTLNGQGKVGQGEFKILEPKFPGIDTTPGATNMVFNLVKQQAGRTYAEQQALAQTAQTNPNAVLNFPATWAKYLDDTGTLKASAGRPVAPTGPVPQANIDALLKKYAP